MRVELLGTGAADGWPNPFCRCVSCTAAWAAGIVRGQTSALVDGRLLLDCGPETPRAAARLGRSLAGVRHILLGHAHPDHTAPAALLFRSWAGLVDPVEVVGPPAAIDACRPWVAPADPVTFRPVVVGDELRLGGYRVRAIPASHDPAAGPPVLYDVTDEQDTRMLYAVDTGPLTGRALADVTGRAYHLVLLEETMGEADGQAAGHHDLATFPGTLAELRRRGAVTASTRVLAVHLGHANPPPAECARRLAAWDVGCPVDGDVVVAGTGAVRHGASVTARRRVLVLGGARSGKSVEAERRLAAEPTVTYLATGLRAADPDWDRRVAAHRARRPGGWRTVETTDLAGPLATTPGAVLVDDLGLWLTAVLDAAGWPEPAAAAGAVDTALADLLVAWRSGPADTVVAVSNEVGSGVVPATESGRTFRDALGRVNAAVAAASDEVWLVVAGLAQRLR